MTKYTKQIAVCAAMALFTPWANAQTFVPNSSQSHPDSVADLNLLSIGGLPAGIQDVVDDLNGYLDFEQTKNDTLQFNVEAAQTTLDEFEADAADKVDEINALIANDPLDPQIGGEEANLDSIQADVATANSSLSDAKSVKTNSDTKIFLYQQALDGPVAGAQDAAADAATDITQAVADFSDPNSSADGLEGIIAKVDGVAAGDQAPIVGAIEGANTTFAGIGADNADFADIQALVGVINAELPNLPPISNADKDTTLDLVLNGSYERVAIAENAAGMETLNGDASVAGSVANTVNTELDNIGVGADGIEGIIEKEADGSIHIGENSLITNEVGGQQVLYAEDAANTPIDIAIANGSNLNVETNLNVDGLASLDGGIAVDGNNDGINEFSVNGANGDVTSLGTIAGGTLTDGTAILAGGSLTGAINVSTVTLNATGVATLSGGAAITGGTTTDTLTVSGATITNGITNTGDINNTGNISTTNDLSVGNDASITRDLAVGRDLSVANDGNFGNNLNVGGDVFVGGRTQGLQSQVDRNRRDIEANARGIAMTAALTHTTVLPGMTNALDVSAAHFEGETGMSINYARRINENWQINFGAASTTDFDESVIKAGVGVQW